MDRLTNPNGAVATRYQHPVCCCCEVLSGDWVDTFGNHFCRFCFMGCQDVCVLLEVRA